MLIKCSTCGVPISKGWLFLGFPWSLYTCSRCGAVYAGTLLRVLLLSVASGFLGYVLIGAIKGRTSPFLLVPALALTLILLFVNLPKQVKRVDDAGRSSNSEPE
jgi:hypothetical protein